MKLNIRSLNTLYDGSPAILSDEHGDTKLRKLNLDFTAGEYPVITAEVVIMDVFEAAIEAGPHILNVDAVLFFSDGERRQRVRSMVLEDGTTLEFPPRPHGEAGRG